MLLLWGTLAVISSISDAQHISVGVIESEKPVIKVSMICVELIVGFS